MSDNVPVVKLEVDLTELVELYGRALASQDALATEAAGIAVAEAAAAEAATIQMLAFEAMAQHRLK